MEEELEDDVVEILTGLKKSMEDLIARVRYLEGYLKDEGYGVGSLDDDDTE